MRKPVSEVTRSYAPFLTPLQIGSEVTRILKK
jgi:hypothetical protein